MIAPANMMAGRQWMLKASGNMPDFQRANEVLVFAQTNPHADWLRRIFSIAGIEYGRIDYAVQEGLPQVWGINLNPTLTRTHYARHDELPSEVRSLQAEAGVLIRSAFSTAWQALDPWVAPEPITLTPDPSLIARVTSERTTARRWTDLRACLGRLYEHPQMGAPFRLLYGRAFQRL